MFSKNHQLAIVRFGMILVLLVSMLGVEGLGVQPARAETLGFGWVQGGGGVNWDYGTAVAVDGSGNVYATGFVSNAPGNQDVFIHKWDGDANLIWSNGISGPSGETTYAVTLDGTGNVYVAGSFSDTVDFDPGPGTSNLTSAGLTDAFVIKYDSSGSLIWVKSMGGTSSDECTGVAVDDSGDLYLTGSYSDTVDFDPGPGTSNLTSAGDADVFVSSLDGDGNFIWAKSLGGASTEKSFDIALAEGGGVILTGFFSATADFDPGVGTTTLTSEGETDVFVSKLDGSGNFGWVQKAGGPLADTGIEIALDGSGNIYLVGYYSISGYENDILVGKLDGSGTFTWAKTIGGTSIDAGYGLALGSDGGVYITGEFGGTVDFDPGEGISNLTSAGVSDIFISKLDSDGNFAWAENLGATSADTGEGLAVDAGNLYLTGLFSETVDFDPGAGVSNLTSAGASDVFLSKLTLTSQVYYVKWDATGSHDGSSWDNAYQDLQPALAAASSGDEIWVAAGTYKPTIGTDRTASFTLKNGVRVYGGFAGTESARDQRDPTANLTILNGDLNGDDSNNISYYELTRADNSYHVVVGSNTDNTAILDGFIIRAGHANGDSLANDNKGAGMLVLDGSPTLQDITFSGNTATDGSGMYLGSGSPSFLNVDFLNNACSTFGAGGGMYIESGSPALADVTFTNNSAGVSMGGGGGGLFNTSGSPTLTDVTFDNNYSNGEGGGMYTGGGHPVLTDVVFLSNHAVDKGGGLRTNGGTPVLTDVTFENNTAFDGGGMYDVVDSVLTNVTFNGNTADRFSGGMYNELGNPVLTNVTFFNNEAIDGSGGGMLIGGSPVLTNVTFVNNRANHPTYGTGGGMYISSVSSPTIRNVILWGNSATDGSQLRSIGTPTISNSVVQGGYPGGTNIITTDPMLGTLDNYGGNTQTIPILSSSSAINQGNVDYCPDTDQRGVLRLEDDSCDIGAYEYVPTIHYVKADAGGANNGSSWENAYRDLQSALAAASSGDEIWVAAGTYKPTTGTDRTATFQLKSGVAIYGGFDGLETARNQRDPAANVTILSGDIDNNDSQTPVITNLDTVTGNATNSYHVVTGANGATLDGLTITAGYADGAYPDNSGGGMYNNSAAPGLANISFSGNFVAGLGGGMFNGLNSSPTLTNVTFSSNTAGSGGGMENSDYSSPSLTNVTFNNNSAGSGSGMYNYNNSSPGLINVTFSGNWGTSGSRGGAMVNDTNSNSSLMNVTFVNNSVTFIGGAMMNFGSTPELVNVTFHGNSSTDRGGAMYNWESSPILENITFSGNSAPAAGAVYNDSNSNPSIANSILYGDAGGEITNNSGTATVTYSIVQGGYSGIGNLDADPLLGPLQDNGGFTKTMALGPGSPAVDAGTGVGCPEFDQRGVTRPQGSGCDIGAYESNVWVVTSTADSGPGTLRQAVADAADGDTIRFAPSLAGQTIGLTYNLYIDKDLRIDGSGLSPQVTISGQNLGHLEVPEGATVLISDVTIAHGNFGILIWHGDLTIRNSTLRDSVNDSGGAISNFAGSLTIENSTITQNHSHYHGGAIYVGGSGSARIVNSTITQNQADHNGGAMFLQDNATVEIINSTIAGNSGSTGSEISISAFNPGSLTATNSLFVCLPPSTSCYDYPAGSVTNTNSILGVGVLADFGLGTLGDHGGPTQTMALLPASPAIDAGTETNCPEFDQRGVARPQGRLCDIGAYEYEDNGLPPTVLSSTPADPVPAASVHFTVTFSESVTGVDENDFVLATSGLTGVQITDVSGSGTTYTVTVNTGTTGSSDGTLGLDVVDNDSIRDVFNNPLGGPGEGNGNFDASEFYTIPARATNLSAPVLLSPRRNQTISDSTPEFSWRSVTNAVHYEIVFATNSTFTQNVDPHFADEASFVSDALDDGRYYWRVRAYNDLGQPGPWSGSRSFTIDTTAPPPPASTSPADGTALRGVPTFRWSAVSGAVLYELEVDDEDTFVSPLYSIVQRLTSRRLPGGLRGTYYWRVRARDVAGNWGPWSSVSSINILPSR